ncbi:hypothetical protein L1887_02930 [Cichorium endivia]|nr:hypothetical protein L1887_02930 [Cichorium endivia]
MWPEKKRTNAWQCPEQETTDLAGEKRIMKLEEIDNELAHSKRRKSSSSLTTNKLLSEYNPLNEPSPLGLKLDKSPSFLKLIQTRLKQANNNDTSLPSENLKVGKKKNVKAKVGESESFDKIKASNFPALLLRIGNWEYVSKHEGDLVAKCYFAKHRLVWEILDGDLINRIEIQWEDILCLKADFPEIGPDTLTVTLRKEPLFFREMIPQPRRHTNWEPTSDFTGGEANRIRQHYLQCAQGVLDKHYAKLIRCDTRLNFLSQKFDTFLDESFPQAAIKAPNISDNIVSNRPEMSEVPSVDINGMVLQPTSQCLLADANFAQNDTWKNNINGWQDGNYYSSPDGMMLSLPSQPLLKDVNSTQEDTEETHVSGWQDGNNYSNLVCNLPSVDYRMKQWSEEEFGGVSGYNQDLGMSRKESFSDLLNQLPAGFLFDDFEDDKILYP